MLWNIQIREVKSLLETELPEWGLLLEKIKRGVEGKERGGGGEHIKCHRGLWGEVKERDALRENLSMSIMQTKREVWVSNQQTTGSRSSKTEYPHAHEHRAIRTDAPMHGGYQQQQTTHRLVRRLVTVTFWGADTEPDWWASHLFRWWQFSPSHGVLHPLQLTVQSSCQFLNFVIKFRWFKCELFSIENFGWPYKMQLHTQDYNIVSLDLFQYYLLIAKRAIFSFSLNNQSSH